jgi:hypothetical protein
MAKRRARVRYRSVRGGHYGEFGPRYLGYRMPIHVRHYKRTRRTRRNPFFRNPGGGTNWLLIGAVAVGGFFLLRGGGLTSVFGAPVPAGYTQLGTSGYYRGPDGQLYNRTATGAMTLSPTQAPVGSAVEQQLIAAGSRLALPVVGALATGLSQMIGNLFSTGSATGTGTPSDTTTLPTGGASVTSPDILTGAGTTSLPPLEPLPDLSLSSDFFSAPSTVDWFSQPGAFTLDTQPVMSMDLSLAPLPDLQPVDYSSGFFGLGRLYYQAGRGGYGLARRSPSGEVEARFMRQPPSFR